MAHLTSHDDRRSNTPSMISDQDAAHMLDGFFSSSGDNLTLELRDAFTASTGISDGNILLHSEVREAGAESQARLRPPSRHTWVFHCRARNVGPGHNSETAFVEVPHNTAHGTVLYCSHPSCVVSGRAFRWCAVCKVAAARRNFQQRHGHDDKTGVRPRNLAPFFSTERNPSFTNVNNYSLATARLMFLQRQSVRREGSRRTDDLYEPIESDPFDLDEMGDIDQIFDSD